jgi:hypothetical protein
MRCPGCADPSHARRGPQPPSWGNHRRNYVSIHRFIDVAEALLVEDRRSESERPTPVRRGPVSGTGWTPRAGIAARNGRLPASPRASGIPHRRLRPAPPRGRTRSRSADAGPTTAARCAPTSSAAGERRPACRPWIHGVRRRRHGHPVRDAALQAWVAPPFRERSRRGDRHTRQLRGSAFPFAFPLLARARERGCPAARSSWPSPLRGTGGVAMWVNGITIERPAQQRHLRGGAVRIRAQRNPGSPLVCRRS